MQNQPHESKENAAEGRSNPARRYALPAGICLTLGSAWFACQSRKEEGEAASAKAIDSVQQDDFSKLRMPAVELPAERIEVIEAQSPQEVVPPVTLHPSYELKLVIVDTKGNPLCDIEPVFLLKNPGATPEGQTQLAQPFRKTNLQGETVKTLKQERLVKGVTERLEDGLSVAPDKQPPPAEGFSRIEIFATKRGYAQVRQIVDLDLRKESHEITLTLDRGFGVFGTVHYADGTPVVDGLGACGLNNIFTNNKGEIVTYERDCFDNKVEVLGVSGFKHDELNSYRIWSKTPGFSEFSGSIKFEGDDIYLDAVLHPTSPVLLTVRDCASGELISPDSLGVNQGRAPSEPAYGTRRGGIQSLDSEGKPGKYAFHLQYSDARYLIVAAEEYLPRGIVLPESAVGAGAPLEFDTCLTRLKALSILGTIETIGGDGQKTETAAGRFRVSFTLSFANNESYSTTTDIPAGAPFKPAWVFQHAILKNNGVDREVTGVAVTKIECISPDLRPAELTDAAGQVLAPKSDFPFGANPLLKPISLIAAPGDLSPNLATIHLYIRQNGN